jgi:hypothetical protein
MVSYQVLLCCDFKQKNPRKYAVLAAFARKRGINLRIGVRDQICHQKCLTKQEL